MSNLEVRNRILEKEKARLMRKINSLEERERVNQLSHQDTNAQLMDGRQILYDRLEECLEAENSQQMKQDIANIIEQLRLRSGAYGDERKNLINSLFKNIIDSSFPNIIKYLFWASDQQSGIFEKLDPKEYTKFKSMSKYKKDEMIAGNKDKQSVSSDDFDKTKFEDDKEFTSQTIN